MLEILQAVSLDCEKSIKVILLGKNQDHLDFSSYEHESLSVITFNTIIPDREYIEYLKTSDLGILPLVEEIDHKGILETKGTSNISGGVNDFCFVGLLGLIPSFYGEKDNDLIQSYSSRADLEKKLQLCLGSEKAGKAAESNISHLNHEICLWNSNALKKLSTKDA